jgi:hypothetical protein
MNLSELGLPSCTVVLDYKQFSANFAHHGSVKLPLPLLPEMVKGRDKQLCNLHDNYIIIMIFSLKTAKLNEIFCM